LSSPASRAATSLRRSLTHLNHLFWELLRQAEEYGFPSGQWGNRTFLLSTVALGIWSEKRTPTGGERRSARHAGGALRRSLVQTACYPLAACAAAWHNCAQASAVLWAAATFLVGVSDTPGITASAVLWAAANFLIGVSYTFVLVHELALVLLCLGNLKFAPWIVDLLLL
jgi:hypothetical protein